MARHSVSMSIFMIGGVLSAGCRPDTAPATTSSNLTAGMAKRTITKGVTTESSVAEVFGPPDLVTHNEAGEVWTYDKIHNEVDNSGGYLTVGVIGIGSGGTRSSSTSTMLIIYFDAKDVVRDYRMSVSRF